MKSIFNFFAEIFKIVVIALLIVLPIRYFLFQPFFVKGQSMEPNFEGGDYLIVDEISYRLREPLRGEVVVFKNPQNPSQRFIKRIIGLPGETLELKDGRVVIFTKPKKFILDESAYLPPFTQTNARGYEIVTLKRDEYFVLGDNRANSSDSRIFGALPRDNIIGRVLLRPWPFTALAKIEVPEYQK
jgi:signal peptidase I